jgi:hypothetical protein
VFRTRFRHVIYAEAHARHSTSKKGADLHDKEPWDALETGWVVLDIPCGGATPKNGSNGMIDQIPQTVPFGKL